MNKRNASVPLILALIAALAFPAAADVTIHETLTSGGLRGFGAYKAVVVRQIQGVKSREDWNKRFTGAVLGLFSGKKGRDSATILRVDLGKRWVLDARRKTYEEFPISAPPPARTSVSEEAPSAGQEPTKPTTRIVENKFKVDATGEQKTFGSFTATRYKIDYTLVTENLKTRARSKLRMRADYWTTPWTGSLKAADGEELAFSKAYLDKAVGSALGDPRNMGLSMLGAMTSAGHADVAKSQADFRAQIAKISGFPVVIDTRWYSSTGDGGQAAPARNKDASDQSALSQAASGDVGGAVAGFFGRMAAKAVEKRAAASASSGGPDGLGKPVFSSRIEIESVSTKSVPPARFEIPAGYQKRA